MSANISENSFQLKNYNKDRYRLEANGLDRLWGAPKNVSEAVSARQKQAKKRSLRVVNEHFELVFNAAMTTQVVFRGTLWWPACTRSPAMKATLRPATVADI